MANKMDFDELELSESEVARRRAAEVEAWRNRTVAYDIGQGLAGIRGEVMFAD